MTKIRMTEKAYVCNGEYRLHTDEGRPSAWVLKEWYQATAEDEQGRTYQVYYIIREEYDREKMEENAACDWNEPIEVIRDDGTNVTRNVMIE